MKDNNLQRHDYVHDSRSAAINSDLLLHNKVPSNNTLSTRRVL